MRAGSALMARRGKTNQPMRIASEAQIYELGARDKQDRKSPCCDENHATWPWFHPSSCYIGQLAPPVEE
jgi:hypothetical protein